MAEIHKYVLVDPDGNEGDWGYDTFAEARENSDGLDAIVERTYEYSDSELVWTPDGSRTWPPDRSPEDEEE